MTLDLSGAQWRKSTHSDEHGGSCVEVAALAPVVAVRDSTDPDGPVLGFSRTAFTAFIGAIRAGSHNL
ncbi:DUF397 domain-containing protein [Actinomadura rubrisoli]|uniref:DUF397 domain-containing protein n=1 Tax=Actinomadura rubrisoli TaxID=2530368 RepID=A0A4R5BFA3_9ACTN|nr:DUF397 domain-containing protein [Actinomadura rubrisoli]TDD83943.1 DUF397 domain-containing protein [Actinomadura rubrisoli]